MVSEALALHSKLRGKLSVESKLKINSKKDLSLAYTPGVAEPCIEIARDKKRVYEYTIKGNTVAVITDGTAVLGLGDIGPSASLPVMEGKALLLKEFAGIDSFPIVLDTKDVDEIVRTIKIISPGFGGINLEDISAPRCFAIEEKLQDMGIPVMHDDQHGTAVVVYAALINALKVVRKKMNEINVVINGAGAAGSAIAKILLGIDSNNRDNNSVRNVLIVDSKGIIGKERNDLDEYKKKLAETTNKGNLSGNLADALKGADVFIGVSKGNVVSKEMIKSMAKNPIVFARANPVPEIMPVDAISAGAAVVGTGRSDFPNQINNVLAFPGIFKGALDAKATKITPKMKLAAAIALANCVDSPTKDNILPDPIDKTVALKVAQAVKEVAIEENNTRK